MKRRANDDLNPSVFGEALQRVKNAFPYGGINLGFFTHDPAGASVFGGIAKTAKSVLMSIRGDSVDIRAYREPKIPNATVLYKVDETRGANKAVVVIPEGHEIPDHHISHDIQEDMMRQNNMSVEMVPDGKGGLMPNVQPDGTVEAYINFPDPTEEILRRARERAQNRQKEN